MSRFGRHFVRTKDIKAFEQRLIRLVVDQPGMLNTKQEALYRYACVLARTNLFRAPDGKDIDLSSEVDELRRWVLESIVPLLPEKGPPDVHGLKDFAPILSVRLETCRRALLEHHLQDFGAEHLDEEIRHKKLGMALGGGGGSGMAHLGTFSLLNEMGVEPTLIAGASMGAMMGAIRAINKTYDPVATAMAMPKDVDLGSLFRPYSGYSRFGFPGAFHMNLLRLSRAVFKNLVGKTVVQFDELPIKLHVVTTGIRTGFNLDEEAYVNEQSSPASMRSKLRTFFKLVRQISANPRFLAQIVFGKEPGTEAFSVMEAVGFSCAVPGLLHYDIYHDDPDIITPLETIFERHQLLRLCDGGVINNVPSQVVWESVQQGSVGTRNVMVMGCDVFAPASIGRNMLWIPVQQIARQSVLANLPYADYHKTFKSPPSPLQLIVNQEDRVRNIVLNAKRELEEDEPYIKRNLKSLPEYGIWRGDS